MGNWDGAVLQHGEPDLTRYRHIAWLGDGKRLVATADPGTEPRLVVFEPESAAPPRVLDGVDIGQSDRAGRRARRRCGRGAHASRRDPARRRGAASSRVLDTTAFGRGELANRGRGLAWAPDGRWLAYAFGISAQQVAIKLCRVETGETWQISEPVLYDTRPAFDPQGKYLYFIGARDFDPVQDNLGFEFSFPKGQRPYLVTLRRDLRSPFAPTSERPKDELAEKLEQAKKTEESEKKQPTPVEIDIDGIRDRIVAFPVPESIYRARSGHA